MKKQVYRHIGYYSGKEALELCNYRADYVVATMTNQIGTFHTLTNEPQPDVEDINAEADSSSFEKTSNGDYLVRYPNGSTQGKDWFVDIYKLTVIDDDTNETVESTNEEYCSNCNSTIETSGEFKLHICPECGEYVVPCNICPLDDHSRNCTNCPLAILATKLNRKARGEMTFHEFVDMFNNSDDSEKQRGFYLSYVDGCSNNRDIYCHYNTLYEMVTIFDVRNGGLSYTMKGDKIDITRFASAVETISANFLNRLMVMKVKEHIKVHD